MSNNKTMLEICELSVHFNAIEVLKSLNLSVDAGKLYALLGGNGAGKTTTINTVLGFVSPSSGRVLVDGVSPAEDAEHVRKALAYLPENVALYSYLSGIENLIYFCALAGIKISREKSRQLLSAAGLQKSFQDTRVAKYSKGMRQKVGLAIAHAKQAKLMLLDEPTSGLDPAAANDFAASLREAKSRGMAILMATHDLFNAIQVADRIGIMKEGRLVEEFDASTVGHDELEQKYLLHARGMAA